MAKAGFFPRFIAYLVDVVAISIIAWGLSLLIGGLTNVTSNSDSLILGILSGTLVVILVFAVINLAVSLFWLFLE